MKKRICLIMAIALAVGLVGCGRKKATVSVPPMSSMVASMMPSAISSMMPSTDATAGGTGKISATAEIVGTPKPTTKADAKATATKSPTAQSAQTALSGEAAFRAEVLRLVNVEREKKGLSPLSDDNDSLNKAAEERAGEIVDNFSHTRPSGKACFTVLDDHKIDHTACGENIAAGQQTPAEVVSAWMNSAGHRENILSKRYTHMGVGMKKGSMGIYWCQLFIG